jgi:hypothetical protein
LKAIEEGDAKTLLDLALGKPCACKGPRDREPFCECRMMSLTCRGMVSLAGLRLRKIIRLRDEASKP